MWRHQLKSTLATRDFTQALQGRKPCVSCEVKTDFPTILLDLTSSELVHLELVYQTKSAHQLQAAIQLIFPPLFSPTKSQTKPQQDPPCLQAPTCHGPSWTQQTPSQICSRTWQPPTLSLRNASGLRRCWVFSPDAPHGKTNKHTHLLTAP